MTEPLVARARRLLTTALDAHPNAAVANELAAARARLDEPLRVAVAGKVKAGKSTLVNALIGEELAMTDAGECTRIVTWYQDGITYRVTMHPRDGKPAPAPFARDGGPLVIDLERRRAGEVERLVVEWPLASLREMTLIDTPGLGSLSAEGSERNDAFLVPEGDEAPAADAVVYLMRHLHSNDVSFLESFHDDIGHVTAINAIGVLSRADEIAGGRLDAMGSAQRVADRYAADPKVRRLCQTVAPVAGLLAQAGAGLTEGEYRALQRIADAPHPDADALMLTADRLLHAETPIMVTPDERARLAQRFGLFGVRLGASLIRQGAVRSATELAEELVATSGIRRLRAMLISQFGARGDVLKARSALLALASALRRSEIASPSLAADLERTMTAAHEFAEIRLLDAHRRGELRLPAEEAADLERLLGVSGTTVTDRLGLPAGAEPAEIGEALQAAVTRWQARAENPLSSREITEAAHILVRSCEGLVAAGPTYA